MSNKPEWERIARNNYEWGYGSINHVTYRGLFANPDTAIEGYRDILPPVDGLLIDQWLQYKHHAGRDITLCDAGYGKGKFLLDLSLRFPNVNGIAFGDPSSSRHHTQMLNGRMYPPTEKFLREAGITMIEGNLIDIDQLIRPKSVDIFIMSNILGHVRAPRDIVFSRMISCLAAGGQIISADSRRTFWEPETDGNFSDTQKCLNRLGYDLKLDIREFRRPKCPDIQYSYTTHVFPLGYAPIL
jgi:hypothetical protein